MADRPIAGRPTLGDRLVTQSIATFELALPGASPPIIGVHIIASGTPRFPRGKADGLNPTSLHPARSAEPLTVFTSLACSPSVPTRGPDWLGEACRPRTTTWPRTFLGPNTNREYPERPYDHMAD